MGDNIDDGTSRRPTAFRVAMAVFSTLCFCLAVYALLAFGSPGGGGLISFSFLIALPAAVSAFVAYVSDLDGKRSLGGYLRVPIWLLIPVVVVSLVLLREGVICILMMAPLWILSGMAGAGIVHKLRRRFGANRAYCAATLVLPLVAMQIEPMVPLPVEEATVSRSIVVDAAPGRIWPLLRGIPDVRAGEGRWNVSQDVIGVPRPTGARLIGSGIGADRFSEWGRGIRFRERITEWRVNRRIGWRFLFYDQSGWDFTDPHLRPDSPYLRITTGGYTLTPLAPGRTQVTLETRYRMRTPVNGYSRLWGELFLGDISGNLLALIRQRAERGRAAES